jgi:peptidylprolyl isomerase/FKBP-type peptidyl-prolyl cis-trans isomerase FkpA
MQNIRPYLALLLLAGCSEAPLPPSGMASPSPAASPAASASPTAAPTPTPTPTPPNTDVDTTLPSGVGYRILVKAPEGARVCKNGDTVSMDYTGWLVNGTQFDSSIGKKPYSFKLGTGAVIQGWHLGIAGMALGETRKLVLPPDVAYGKAGSPPRIPADATLIFQVKLVAVQ